MTEHTQPKPGHYPFRYEQHNDRAFVPTGRLVTNDGQTLVDGILSADFGYRLALCINFCAKIANSDLVDNSLLQFYNPVTKKEDYDDKILTR